MTDDVRVDWTGWLRRWDRQQEGYVPEREARFTAMFEAVDALMPEDFVALDLGAGPGSLSQRLLTHFPAASAVAVEIDPCMVALGREAVGNFDGRLRWVEADLASPKWVEQLGLERVDVALSATALHWLPPAPLKRLYRDLADVIRPGGLLVNADNISFGLPTIDQLSKAALDKQWTDDSFESRGIETAEQWWQAFKREPAVAALLDEQARRFADKQRQPSLPDICAHESALLEAGFSEVATIWQRLSDRVVLAVR